MCYKGKCLDCIPVENGCLAFAIISAVVTGLTLVGSIIAGLLTISEVIYATHEIHAGRLEFPPELQKVFNELSDSDIPIDDEGVVAVAGITVGIILGIVALASLIAFIFSVLLCNGICNRRPGQVKAYFVYGVVTSVLAVLASLAEIRTQQDPSPGIMGMLGCAIYSLFLVMVHKTYAKLLEGTVFTVKGGHVRLVES